MKPNVRWPSSSPGESGAPSLPRVCVATRWLGVRSQVWLWRQLRLLERLEPSVLTWKYENRADYPIDGTPIRLIDTEEEPNLGPRRWWWRLRNLPSGNFFATHGRELRLLARSVAELRPQVLLAQFGHVGLRMLPVAERLRLPLVVHFHGADISSNLQMRYYRWSLRRALPRIAAAVCVGEHQRTELLRLGMAPERIQVIPCGVPTEEFLPVRRLPRASVTFLAVSRLEPFKGLHHSLAAFAAMANKVPGSRMVVLGDGPELDHLMHLAAQRGVADRVQFLGALPPRDVRRWMEEADVFVQHSVTHRSGWSEGFGVSIAEAAATGLPVVVSSCGGITEQVVDGVTGVVVPERDEAAMADAMLALARDPERRAQLGAAGRQRMVERFDTRLQVRKLEDVLLAAINTSSRAPTGG